MWFLSNSRVEWLCFWVVNVVVVVGAVQGSWWGGSLFSQIMLQVCGSERVAGVLTVWELWDSMRESWQYERLMTSKWGSKTEIFLSCPVCPSVCPEKGSRNMFSLPNKHPCCVFSGVCRKSQSCLHLHCFQFAFLTNCPKWWLFLASSFFSFQGSAKLMVCWERKWEVEAMMWPLSHCHHRGWTASWGAGVGSGGLEPGQALFRRMEGTGSVELTTIHYVGKQDRICGWGGQWVSVGSNAFSLFWLYI